MFRRTFGLSWLDYAKMFIDGLDMTEGVSFSHGRAGTDERTVYIQPSAKKRGTLGFTEFVDIWKQELMITMKHLGFESMEILDFGNCSQMQGNLSLGFVFAVCFRVMFFP